MSVMMPRMMLMASLLSLAAMWPTVSSALGLGEIHLNSALNEPMNAEIDLIAASPDELSALHAALAPRDAFTRYGIDRPPFLSSLIFKVGKSKAGRDVLQVRSSDSIPEPFVTFLVEVNWARGRLMREYTVLLDPPVYSPGENPNATPPVAAPTTAGDSSAPPVKTQAAASAAPPAASSASTKTPRHRAGHRAPAAEPSVATPPLVAQSPPAPAAAETTDSGAPGTVRVAKGDTLTKIAKNLHGDSQADIDQTMIALYRSNPEAFGGNINVLRSGAVLRVPNADDIATLNQKEAMGEVHRQMDAWRSGGANTAAAPSGHLRLVTPTGGGNGTTSGSGDSSALTAENQTLKERVKDLEGQLSDSKRLLDLKNNELADLQHRLAAPPPAVTAPAPPPKIAETPVPQAAPPQPEPQPLPPPAVTPPPEAAPPVSAVTPPPAPPVIAAQPAPPPVKKPQPAAAPVESGSWVDWVSDHWWIPLAAVLAAILALLAVNAARKRRQSQVSALDEVDPVLEETHVSDMDPSNRVTAIRKPSDSFVVEESGSHPVPDFTADSGRFGDTGELRSADDTLSSESAVNLDQGDPLAEADFHMAYGLYDQAADLVRIALEREPERRDLRMKLLEIYFVWGNKDAFLQTARQLEASRDRAPAGEWDKIVIMGKQICPEEPMFAGSTGGGRGAGALVDLNLEGGENRVDIDLFGEPEGERSAAGDSAGVRAASDSGLDFTLDAPERGADESPTREIPPRDEPTVEAEMMNLADAPTTESPALKTAEMKGGKFGAKPDQTAEVSIDDLGLDLDQLEQTGQPSAPSLAHLEETDHPADAPTMVAGLDERSRRMMEDAARASRDRDLTELERELEASFIADLDQHQEEIKTAVLGPESAPTVLMPREQEELDPAATGRMKAVSPEFSDGHDAGEGSDLDSTSKLRGINADSIDLDLDRLATALSSGDTREQPRAAEEIFSTEVFEASQRNRRVDLDVGEAMNGSEHATNKLQVSTNKLQVSTSKLKPVDLPLPEMEPVTMSEVGTKLDLARAYMDMGDPEGARSILEEVVQEGSASQKQEASRLIESLPG